MGLPGGAGQGPFQLPVPPPPGARAVGPAGTVRGRPERAAGADPRVGADHGGRVDPGLHGPPSHARGVAGGVRGARELPRREVSGARAVLLPARAPGDVRGAAAGGQPPRGVLGPGAPAGGGVVPAGRGGAGAGRGAYRGGCRARPSGHPPDGAVVRTLAAAAVRAVHRKGAARLPQGGPRGARGGAAVGGRGRLLRPAVSRRRPRGCRRGGAPGGRCKAGAGRRNCGRVRP